MFKIHNNITSHIPKYRIGNEYNLIIYNVGNKKFILYITISKHIIVVIIVVYCMICKTDYNKMKIWN